MNAALAHAAVYVPVAILTAVLMDLWAALLHGRLWHRALFFVHASHHRPRPHGERFEANDVLSGTHAPAAIALILWGCRAEPSVLREVAFGVGVGMSLFGVAYLVVHDGVAHHRLPVRWLLRFGYIRQVVRAHFIHHQGGETEEGGRPPYGFFFGPWELARVTRSRSTPSAQAQLPSGSP